MPSPTSDRQPRRILYVEGNVDGTVGGSFFSLFYLVSRLDRSRYRPLVAFRADNPIITDFHAAGVETRVIPPRPVLILPTPIGRIAAKAGNFLQGFALEPWALARMMRRERIDLVHLNNSITRNHVWMIAARMARIPCVTHERGINPHYLKRSLTLGRGLEAVICISDAVRNNFAELGIRGLRLVTIPNALDPEELRVRRGPTQVRLEYGLSPERPLVGMVGNIKHWKGQEVLIRALAILRNRFPGLACLLIGDTAKESADYGHHIRELVKQLGLADHVIITGYRKDVADHVNAVQILVHASILPEPFGRVLLEGMALRKPLVASAGGGVPEIVVDGVTGLLFRPGDSNHLAQCLERLLEDPAMRSAMGEAGYRRLVQHFSIDRNVSATQQLYDQLLG
jgi:glycosyltransferase involved in cell wall biosynthesis